MNAKDQPGMELLHRQPSLPPSERGSPAVPLSLAHALRIKSAEYWLQLGQAAEALKELERLPKAVLDHPRIIKARVAALGILRERNESALPK